MEAINFKEKKISFIKDKSRSLNNSSEVLSDDALNVRRTSSFDSDDSLYQSDYSGSQDISQSEIALALDDLNRSLEEFDVSSSQEFLEDFLDDENFTPDNLDPICCVVREKNAKLPVVKSCQKYKEFFSKKESYLFGPFKGELKQSSSRNECLINKSQLKVSKCRNIFKKIEKNQEYCLTSEEEFTTIIVLLIIIIFLSLILSNPWSRNVSSGVFALVIMFCLSK